MSPYNFMQSHNCEIVGHEFTPQNPSVISPFFLTQFIFILINIDRCPYLSLTLQNFKLIGDPLGQWAQYTFSNK